MPLSPQRRPTLPAVNPTLTNADQIVTKVDTRLTKVDKTDHRQPPSHPQTPAKHSTITTAPTIPPLPVSTSVVNPSGTPRTNPNNPEQIRTDPNNPEHHRTPRPDRTTLRNTPEHPEKKPTLNTVAARLVSETGDPRIRTRFGAAGDLHANCCEGWLPAEIVEGHLSDIHLLVAALGELSS